MTKPKRQSTRETLARNLAMLMEVREVNQTQLEKLSGVAQKTISNMLDPNRPGVSSHNVDKVEKVAAVFGLTAWQLLLPNLPKDIEKEADHVSDLVVAYMATPAKSREVILHTAGRERELLRQVMGISNGDK